VFVKALAAQSCPNSRSLAGAAAKGNKKCSFVIDLTTISCSSCRSLAKESIHEMLIQEGHVVVIPTETKRKEKKTKEKKRSKSPSKTYSRSSSLDPNTADSTGYETVHEQDRPDHHM
jgi:hypothetical protein